MDRTFPPHTQSPNRQIHAQASSDPPGSREAMVTSRSGYKTDLDHVSKSGALSYVPPRAATSRVEQQADMAIESNRLATFRQWPETSPVRPSQLSAAGLFYFGHEDSVRCAYCKGVLKRWEADDNPMEEHRKFFPQCRFVCGLDVGNVPVSSDTAPMTSFPVAYRQDVLKVNNRPMRPEFESSGKRLQSFAGHPLPEGQSADELAENGFFWLGPGDAVMCFWCGGSLKHWTPTDRPLSEHLRWFPQCGLLPKLQRQAMESSLRNASISEVSPRSPSKSISREQAVSKGTQPTEPSVSKSGAVNSSEQSGVSGKSSASTLLSSTVRNGEDLEKVQEENRRLKDTLECKICMSRSVNTLFLPCSHLVCCDECAAGCHNCPMCRAEIRGTIRTYL